MSTSFVLGYHGCDSAVAEALVSGKPFKASANDYDWLGEGIYFWESNPRRGLDFAREVRRRKPKSIKHPAVVGAVIDLGQCLDFTTQAAIEFVGVAYESFVETMSARSTPMPVNQDQWRRQLDCAVIQHLHSINETTGNFIDTVRGIFIEGAAAYPGAGFSTKTHVQIAVRNPACIKGVFRVPEDQLRGWSGRSLV